MICQLPFRINQVSVQIRHRVGRLVWSTPEFDLPRPTASLLVQQASPFSGHAALGAWRWLVRRMRSRARQLGALKSFLRSVVVEPLLAGLEAVDDRVAGGRVVL